MRQAGSVSGDATWYSESRGMSCDFEHATWRCGRGGQLAVLAAMVMLAMSWNSSTSDGGQAGGVSGGEGGTDNGGMAGHTVSEAETDACAQQVCQNTIAWPPLNYSSTLGGQLMVNCVGQL